MSSDTALFPDVSNTGNVNDLPPDFFAEPEYNVQNIGSIKDLPDNFFTPVEQQEETLFHEQSEKVISVPTGLNGAEAEYLVDTQVNGKSKEEYFGLTNVGNILKNIPKGYIGAIARYPSTIAGLELGYAEIRLEKMKKTPKEYSNWDLLRQFLPTAEGRFAEIRVSQQLGGDLSFEKERAKLEETRKNAIEVLSMQESVIKGMGLAQDGEGFFEGLSYNAGSGAQNLMQSIALMGVSNSPKLASVVFGGQQKADAYVEARRAGKSPEESEQSANIRAVNQAVIENVGLGYFEKIAKNSKGIKKVFFAALEQGAEEGAQKLTDILITNEYGVTDIDFTTGAGMVAYDTLLGMIVGAPTSLMIESDPKAAEQRYKISSESALKFSKAVEANSEELINAVSKTIEDVASPLVKNPEAQAEVEEIIRKYKAGEDIEVSEEYMYLLDEQEGAFIYTDDEAFDFSETEKVAQAANIPVEELTFNQKQNLAESIQNIKETIPEALVDIDAQLGKGFIPLPKQRPQSLSEFLKSKGGLKIDTGEARRFTKKETPGLKGVANRNGQLTLDEARELAVQEGFILDTEDPNIPAITTTDDLVQALEYESQGFDVVRSQDMGTIMERRAIEDFNDQLDRIRNEQGIKYRMRNISEAFKKGVALAKQDVKAAQTAIIEVIEKAGLTAKDKAKFLRSIKNVQSADQARKNFPRIQERILNLIESEQVRNIKSDIKKALSKTKVRKQAGKPVGRFTPEIQERLDMLRDLSKMGVEEAANELDRRLATEEIPDINQALENAVLASVSGQSKSEELTRTLEEIKALKEEGLSATAERIQEKKSRQSELRSNAHEALEKRAGDPLADQTTLRAKIGKKWRKTVTGFTGMYDGWQGVLDVIFGSKGEAQQALMEDLGFAVSDAFQREKGLAFSATERITQDLIDAFGFKNESQLVRRLREDSNKVDLGIFTDTDGKRVRLQLSKSEARKRWMEMQDPTLEETITEGNKYSEEMISAINQFLTFEDIQAAKAQLKFYQDFYEQVNAVYSKVYGVNLPFNEFYSPINRKHDKSNVSDSFMKEMGYRRSVASGSLKSRSKNIRPLKEQSDILVLQKHVMEMAHFIEFAELIQDINSVFGRGDIRQQIEDKWGKDMLHIVDGFITDFTGGGITTAQNFDWVDRRRVDFTTSVLGLKPALAVKQMMSFPAYAENIPVKDFVAGLVDFATHPIEVGKILNESNLTKTRGDNLTRDIKDASRSNEFSMFKKAQTWRNMLMLSVRLGDRGAIIMGGWSVYKYHRDQGATHEEALKQFDRATSQAQQSSDIDQQSAWQRGGSFAKLFTMFASSPNQYLRREIMAWRQMLRREIPVSEAAKKIFIYHFLLPMMFQFAADLGRWDEENQWRAGIMGSFNGMFIFGDVIATAIMKAQGENYFNKSEVPIAEFVRDFGNFAEHLWDDPDFEDVLAAINDLGEGIGKLTGEPIEQITNIVEGMSDIGEGEPLKGIPKILGWSPKVAEEWAESFE